MQTIKIDGYSDYTISDDGVVTSYKRNASGKALRTQKDALGMQRVILIDDAGERRNLLVANLVAEAFVDNPEDYSCVYHKNNNLQDVNASNLEWRLTVKTSFQSPELQQKVAAYRDMVDYHLESLITDKLHW